MNRQRSKIEFAVCLLFCSCLLGCASKANSPKESNAGSSDTKPEQPVPQAKLNQTKPVNSGQKPGASEPDPGEQPTNQTQKSIPLPRTDQTKESKSPAVTRPSQSIRNPYYSKPVWKLWLNDDSKVDLAGKAVLPVSESSVLYPVDPADKPFLFSKQKQQNSFAGFQDDVYVNFDNRHSWIPTDYAIGQHRVRLKGSVNALERTDLKKVGANFTSQSTTGMGSALANSPQNMELIEKQYYFANTVLCGPTHNSYTERYVSRAADSYQALVPSYFNSIGSSGTEVHAIAKMMIAGAYLDRDLKARIKRLGLYAPTMLYIWKAALPFKVEYEHPLRHRVAYKSFGPRTSYNGAANFNINRDFHYYDEQAHIRSMVRLARNLKQIPPVAMMELMDCSGGDVVYDLYSACLIKQQSKDLVIDLSLQKSVDCFPAIQEIKYRILGGNPATRVEKLSKPNAYRVTIPASSDLPVCRTSIAFFAMNSDGSGNPAILNVFNDASKKQNRRPLIATIPNQIVALGETSSIALDVSDPDQHSLELLAEPHQLAKIQNGKLLLSADKVVGRKVIRVMAIDQFGASSSTQFTLSTTSLAGEIQAQATGQKEVEFRFDTAQPPEANSSFQWTFGDGKGSSEQKPKHRYPVAGYYDVKLALTNDDGISQFQKRVRIESGLKLKSIPLEKIASRSSLKVDQARKCVQFKKSASGSRFELCEIPDQAFELQCELQSIGDCRGGGLVFGNQLLGFNADLKNDRSNRYLSLAPLSATRNTDGLLLTHRIRLSPSTMTVQAFLSPSVGGQRVVNGIIKNELGSSCFYFEVEQLPKVELETGSNGTFRLKQLSTTN